MKLNLLDAKSIKNKTVLVRVDHSVPLKYTAHETQVVDDSRIQQTLKTINFLIQNKAKIILMSHVGRPGGKPDPKLSILPIANHLQKLVEAKVIIATDTIGQDAQQKAKDLKTGQILVLENLRFHPEEKKNDAGFSKKLASLADVYVNEAFSTSHRPHASIVGITKYLPAYAGFDLVNEVEHLSRLMTKPERPFVMVIGGAKISDKVDAVVNLAKIADVVLVGGGVANNFLKAEGIDIAKSYLQDKPADAAKDHINYVAVAEELMDDTRNQRVLLDGYVPLPKIIYPSDVIAAKSLEATSGETIELTNGFLDKKEQHQLMYLDIGPKTQKLYKKIILQAGTIFWNGPMGVFENEAFQKGTKEIARAIAKSGATTVLGGGDTISAIHKFNYQDRYDYVSPSGGASLDFLSGKELPGLKPLLQK